jgi:hypothetical protein
MAFEPPVETVGGAEPPSPTRFDLDADGKFDILDVLLYKPIIMTRCTNS